MNKKYSNLLTVLLIVVIIAILAIIAFLGYRYYESVQIKNNAEEFVNSFIDTNVNTDDKNNNNNTTEVGENENIFEGVEQGETTTSTSPSTRKYNGFEMAGTIEIPATNVNYPIIAKSALSKSALETSVVEMYGVGLNKVGNTTIIGHNYRNGVFFSNNKKLNVGDKIYITDLTGKRVSYTIYSKYEAPESESSYITRDTQGAVEVSLSTCTDDGKARLIILAKADS